MSLCSEVMLCADCEYSWNDLIERSTRDDMHQCPECQLWAAKRTFSVPNVSTTKLSQSIPEAAARGRFDHFREEQTLKKAKAAARVSGDRVTERKVEAEMKKVKVRK